MSNPATLADLRSEHDRLDAELKDLIAKNGGIDNFETWPAGPALRAENLLRALDRLDDGILKREAEQAQRSQQLDEVRRAAALPGGRESMTPEWATGAATSTSHGDDLRSRAARLLDASHRSGSLDDAVAEIVERSLSKPGQSGADFAAWVQASADPNYLTAFAKRMADPLSGHLNWTSEEAEAHRNADVYARTALTLSGASAMLPLALDPSIALTNTGSTGGIRSVCRHETIAAASWNGVTSAGATAEWKTEGSEAADGTPAVAAKNIPVYLLDVDAVVSYEISMDGVNFATELGKVLFDAAAVAVDAALATGSGSGAPTGIITAITGSSQQVLTAGTFASANVTALQNALPARFQPNAKFVTSLPVRNAVNSFETTNGALRFPETANGRLLNRDLVEDSNLATDMTTSGSKFAVYGDWNEFLMVTRTGASIEVLPGYGANGRPTAQKHYFMTLRVGANALVPNGFRYLQKS